MECFRRQELLNWSMFQASYTAVLREGLPEEPATAVFAVGTDEGDMHWKDFEKKLIEHVRYTVNRREIDGVSHKAVL